ncbi:DUF805 domain-containing protein [Enterovibrio norvegicus]|uniref:DUF805 domain-containing protein n=1 Tax=Enterovibrio norvegicus TaxID=188144 RepID=A0A2N7LG04_9GAMM|nr:DUF805 domain-containing protein [Enterovibrio norvegicus]PML81960.1 hypothetical protein BCT69_01065 [Enterovibrio norvegicus]PMN94464.1 hypothetical protein BCT23_09825 [Enterovibrio norvegicus]
MRWLFSAFLNYAKFSGRARRREYWGFFFLQNVVLALCFLIDIAESGVNNFQVLDLQATAVWIALTVIPALSVTVRRFHDINRSGWWWLIIIVPLIGPLIVLIFTLLRGTKGSNRYGCDPKGIFSNSF